MHIKKLILFLFLVPVFASAQKTTGANYTYIAQRYEWLAGVFKALGLPAGDSAQFLPGQEMRAGSVYYDSTGVDSGLHVWTGVYWRNYATASYTDANARAAISLTTTGTSGAATYSSATGVFNIPVYAGTLNDNAGAFYRWLKPATQEIKTFANGYGFLLDSTSNTDALTAILDTATVFPDIRATISSSDDSAYHRMQSVNDTTVVFHSNIAADTLVIRAGTSGSIGSISKNWFDDDLTLNGVTTKINRADFFDDMLTTPTSTAGTSYMLELVSGTGADASIGNTAGTPPDGSGWSVLSTGTTTTGAAGLASTSGTISKLKIDTTKSYLFETKLNIETLSDDTEDFRIVAGFCTWTANTTGTNLIWFRYNDNTNSGNWTCYSADGTTTESTNSGIAAAAGTSVTLAFEYDNAAIRYYINGSLVATHTTRLPQHDASTSYPVISVTKTLGSTARLIYFDYVKYRRL